MRRAAALLVGVALAATACADRGPSLTVLAASSLTDAFEAIERDVEARLDVDVRVSVAGSQQLATQVVEGAPADVLATADEVQMQRVADEGLVAAGPTVFARNRLAIVTGPEVAVDGLAGLADSDLDVVLAAPEVPAGRYARQALDAAGVSVDPVSLEPNVRAVLAKVRLGEADAGIVYATDLPPDPDAQVRGRALPDGVGPEATYSIAVLAGAPHPDLARAFVDHVLSRDGRARLSELGFVVEEDDP